MRMPGAGNKQGYMVAVLDNLLPCHGYWRIIHSVDSIGAFIREQNWSKYDSFQSGLGSERQLKNFSIKTMFFPASVYMLSQNSALII